MIPTRKLFVFLVLLTLTLSACAPSERLTDADTPSLHWTPPPAPLGEEAQSIQRALTLCQKFVSDMNDRYPSYAPSLPDGDISYYERRLSDPETNLTALSSEMVKTISDLR